MARIITGIRVENYRQLRSAKLEGLADLNIFIGPNNCGKTSVLLAIEILSRIDVGAYPFSCKTCAQLPAEKLELTNAFAPVPREDHYLREAPVTLSYSLNETIIDELVPGIPKRLRESLRSAVPGHDFSTITFRGPIGLGTVMEHASIFSHRYILDEIKRSVLFLPEERLQSYKNKSFTDYLKEKNFRGAQLQKLTKFLSELIDPAISDFTSSFQLIRHLEKKEFTTNFQEQGSGVRSMLCLMSDIIGYDNAKIILVDEPELGLNPISKQRLLRFLVEESVNRQIIVATHDPTFVNPILWSAPNTAVFLYSLFKKQFVKVDLEGRKEDPETFAGYLPHTVSLKRLHIYVEGTSDVYILQVFLQKYLRSRSVNWLDDFNRIGMYHLGGDFWSHLLHTIPESPYLPVVILDGDKRELAREVCKEFNSSVATATSQFELAEEPEDILHGKARKVYCLQRKCLEEYLDPKPNYQDQSYDKKKDGVRIAEEMSSVPDELRLIFEAILTP